MNCAPVQPETTAPHPMALSEPLTDSLCAITIFQRATDRMTSDAWRATFANASFSAVYRHFLGESGLTWSAAVIPDDLPFELRDSPTLSIYNGRLQLPVASASAREQEILLLNGRFLPFCQLRDGIEAHRQNDCDVTIFHVHEPHTSRYDERLLVTADGRVQRVTRIYEKAEDFQPKRRDDWAAALFSAQAARSLIDLSLPHKLSEWPATWLSRGLRLQVIGLPGEQFDLLNPNRIDALARALLQHRPACIVQPSGLAPRGDGVWIGKDVALAPNAAIIGPVAIGDGVEIGAGAVIVGPAVVGTGARIAADAVVRSSIVPPHTILGHGPSPFAANKPRRHFTQHVNSPRAAERIRLHRVIQAAGRVRVLESVRHTGFCLTKRAMDVAGSLFFLAFTLPLYPLIALAIKLNSPGSIFYGHTRQGRGGRPFKCWKFRTMVPDADRFREQLVARNEVDGPQFKIRHDPRVFTVGRWLRRLNIDEWPQFYNVLKGEMSIVGPRPSPENENQMCPAWREARLQVRPGVTGLWQVCRQRNAETDFQEWIYYDVQYVKKQSIWLDLKIIVKTFRVALRGT